MIVNAKDFRIIERHGDLAIAEKLVGPIKVNNTRGYALIRMVGNTMSMDLAHRSTVDGIRREASRVHREDHGQR